MGLLLGREGGRKGGRGGGLLIKGRRRPTSKGGGRKERGDGRVVESPPKKSR